MNNAEIKIFRDSNGQCLRYSSLQTMPSTKTYIKKCKCRHPIEMHYHYKKRFKFLWYVLDKKNTSCVDRMCRCHKFEEKKPITEADLIL